jgi:hypothetical protein
MRPLRELAGEAKRESGFNPCSSLAFLTCQPKVFEGFLEAARLVLYQNAYVAGEVPYGEVIGLLWGHGDDFQAGFA